MGSSSLFETKKWLFLEPRIPIKVKDKYYFFFHKVRRAVQEACHTSWSALPKFCIFISTWALVLRIIRWTLIQSLYNWILNKKRLHFLLNSPWKKFHTFGNSRLLYTSHRMSDITCTIWIKRAAGYNYVLPSEGIRFTWFWRSAILWIMMKIFSMIWWGRGDRLNACFIKQLLALDLQLTGVITTPFLLSLWTYSRFSHMYSTRVCFACPIYF